MERPFDYFPERWNHTRALESAIQDGTITPKDSELIKEYIANKEGKKKISLARVNNIVSSLITFRRFMSVPYQGATITDVMQGMATLRKGKTMKKAFPGKQMRDPSPLSRNTIYNRITNTKPFLLWLVENGYFKIPQKKDEDGKNIPRRELNKIVKGEIRAIESGGQSRDTVKPEELYTWNEIQTLIEHCTNSRDRALIIIMYETGARIGELAALRWGDLTFDKYGVKCRILNKKTEQTSKEKYRHSRLTLATEYLISWKRDSPDSSLEALVFVNLHSGEPITRTTVKRLLEKLKKKSGIEKTVRAHMFRHTRATHMIQQNIQESVIKKSLWGDINTPMFDRYVNLTDTAIDKELLKKQAGIDVEEGEPVVPLPITCGNCHTVNQPVNEYCYKCGMSLTEETSARQETILDILKRIAKEDPEGLVDVLKKL